MRAPLSQSSTTDSSAPLVLTICLLNRHRGYYCGFGTVCAGGSASAAADTGNTGRPRACWAGGEEQQAFVLQTRWYQAFEWNGQQVVIADVRDRFAASAYVWRPASIRSRLPQIASGSKRPKAILRFIDSRPSCQCSRQVHRGSHPGQCPANASHVHRLSLVSKYSANRLYRSNSLRPFSEGSAAQRCHSPFTKS